MTRLAVLFSVSSSQTREARRPLVGFVEVADTTVGARLHCDPQRYLLYTGVTRGKKLVVVVGQKKAVAIAVRKLSGRRRWSKLSEWLRPKPPVSRQFGMAS
jgi:hypothetical protein